MICDMANSCANAMTFFGVTQRIYTLFYSIKRWKILWGHALNLTLKPLSQTRWENRIESVKAIRYQAPQIRDVLYQLAETSENPKTRSEIISLATYDIESFEFLLGMIIWYDMLFAINTISKYLQCKDMDIVVTIDHLKGLIAFFKNYRETSFKSSMISAKEIAE